MGILEGLVIATIVLAGAYVGYYAWQDSLNVEDVETHSIDFKSTNYDFEDSYSPVIPIRLF